MSSKKQIDELAKFILAEYSEDIIDGGAGDVAIKIIKRLSILVESAYHEGYGDGYDASDIADSEHDYPKSDTFHDIHYPLTGGGA